MKKIQMMQKSKRRYLIIIGILIFILIVAIIVSCNFVSNLDVEKFWIIAANITVVFGGLGLIYSIFQLYTDNKTMTKETVLLEINLCNELNTLKMLDLDFSEIVLDQELTYNLKISLQYINKIDILSKKELISIEEFSLISGNRLKDLIRLIIKYGYDSLANKGSDAFILILKYKHNIIHVFNALRKNDKDLELLDNKAKSIENAQPKNYIVSNIFNPIQ